MQLLTNARDHLARDQVSVHSGCLVHLGLHISPHALAGSLGQCYLGSELCSVSICLRGHLQQRMSAAQTKPVAQLPMLLMLLARIYVGSLGQSHLSAQLCPVSICLRGRLQQRTSAAQIRPVAKLPMLLLLLARMYDGG